MRFVHSLAMIAAAVSVVAAGGARATDTGPDPKELACKYYEFGGWIDGKPYGYGKYWEIKTKPRPKPPTQQSERPGGPENQAR